MIDIGSETQGVRGGKPDGGDVDLNPLAGCFLPFKSTVVVCGQLLPTRHAEGRARESFRARPEGQDPGACDRLSRGIDDTAPERVGGVKRQVSAQRSIAHFHCSEASDRTPGPGRPESRPSPA